MKLESLTQADHMKRVKKFLIKPMNGSKVEKRKKMLKTGISIKNLQKSITSLQKCI